MRCGAHTMITAERWARLVAVERRPATDDDRRSLLLNDVITLGLDDVAPGVLGCSLTEARRPGGRSTAVSNRLAATLDQAQFDADDGPCLAAARRQRRHQMDVIVEDARFSAFSAAASEVGVLSSLSVPIAGVSAPTSLNMYAGRPAAFTTQRSQAVAGLLARCAAVVLSPSLASDLTAPADDLEAAMAQGLFIVRAQQRLAADAGIAEFEAFTRLAERSRVEQCSIFEVARELLDDQQEAST